MKTIERTIAVGLIFSSDGKIFQGTKDADKGGVYTDEERWYIPGGGVEEGETIEDALVREILEETGIDIKDLPRELVDQDGFGESEKVLSDGEKVKVKMRFYTYKINLPTTAEETKIELNDDIDKYRWTEPEELKILSLTPPSVELFTKLGYL